MCILYNFSSLLLLSSAWKRFDKLYEAYAAEVLAKTGEPCAELYDVNGYGKVDGVKLSVDFIIDNFEELKVWQCLTYVYVVLSVSCTSMASENNMIRSLLLSRPFVTAQFLTPFMHIPCAG